MAKEFPSKKDIETYNKVANYLNDQSEQFRTADTASRDRLPCLLIIAGIVTKVDCKTLKPIP
jgi:hypothetical protein